MAAPVILPRQGQSVETCLIIEWRKAVGDAVAVGDVLCEVETDKATFEVESTEAGTLLTILHDAGADVPVLANLCVVGNEGDDVSEFIGGGEATAETPAAEAETAPAPVAEPTPAAPAAATAPSAPAGTAVGVSPRARQLAAGKGIDPTALAGTGPGGRVIERDVALAVAGGAVATPAALATGSTLPATGSGIGGRVTVGDVAAAGTAPAAAAAAPADDVVITPVKGIRKLIADRMLESLQTTAQLTLTRHANAEVVLGMRKRFKNADESWGLNKVTVNDLILYAVSRTLPKVPELNCLFVDNAIHAYKPVHLGFAVDTPRGLMVPVIRNADTLSLAQLSAEAKRLAAACLEGGISPDELNGGTFTVSNLGAFGIEAFTPVLNSPQVGILGVGGAVLRPIKTADGIDHQQQLALSLTINHQVVDGAPAARFLYALAGALGELDLLLAQ